jgi:hypothetical protein
MIQLRLETTLRRAALALLAGAVCGSVLITALHLGQISRLGRTWTGTAQIAAFISSVYFVLFAFGLLVLAAPAWWLLDRLGQRSRAQAIIFGVALTLASYLAYSQFSRHFLGKLFYGPAPIVWASGFTRGLRGSLPYQLVLFEGAVWYSITGCLLGLLIWRIAYRPAVSQN